MLTETMRRNIEAIGARVGMTKFTSSKQIREYRDAVTAVIQTYIEQAVKLETAINQRKSKNAAVREETRSKIVGTWAEVNIKPGDIVKFKGTRSGSARRISEVTSHNFVARMGKLVLNKDKTGYDFVQDSILTEHMFDKAWKIFRNNEWVDVYKLACGAQ